MASLLAGADAPLDPGDGSGMNLMDLSSGDWWEPAVSATAPGLRDRLPVVRPAWTIAGTLSPVLAAAPWLSGRPCSRVVGRQPVQPDWHRPGA